MTTLYIANTSKQHHDFVFRIASENQRTRVQKILMGEQVRIYRDTDVETIDSIIKQHEQYGLVDASKIDQRKPFIGLCYSVDKPIKVEKFMYASEHNDDVLIDQGREIRKEQAAATYASFEENLPATMRQLSTEVVEETDSSDRGMNEVIAARRDAPAIPPTQGRIAKRSARRAA